MSEPQNVRDIEYLDANFPRGNYDFSAVNGDPIGHWVAFTCDEYSLLVYGSFPDAIWCDHRFALMVWDPNGDHELVFRQDVDGCIVNFVDSVNLIVSLIK